VYLFDIFFRDSRTVRLLNGRNTMNTLGNVLHHAALAARDTARAGCDAMVDNSVDDKLLLIAGRLARRSMSLPSGGVARWDVLARGRLNAASVRIDEARQIAGPSTFDEGRPSAPARS
jgi:hypothetical protein